MRFKIFTAPIVQDEVDEFFNNNIILKDKYLENGNIYAWFQPKDEIGTSPIEEIEELDRVTKQAQKEIFVTNLDKAQAETELVAVEAKIADTDPNMKKDWDALQAKRKGLENEIVLASGTIEDRNLKIEQFRARHQEILNPTTPEPVDPVEPEEPAEK